jgi:hypothetical protein
VDPVRQTKRPSSIKASVKGPGAMRANSKKLRWTLARARLDGFSSKPFDLIETKAYI